MHSLDDLVKFYGFGKIERNWREVKGRTRSVSSFEWGLGLEENWVVEIASQSPWLVWGVPAFSRLKIQCFSIISWREWSGLKEIWSIQQTFFPLPVLSQSIRLFLISPWPLPPIRIELNWKTLNLSRLAGDMDRLTPSSWNRRGSPQTSLIPTSLYCIQKRSLHPLTFTKPFVSLE